MTQFNPLVKLNRLVILTNDGSVAYDEKFHDGVNIIRGHNSTGKSTICNFIFYALGGDFKKWTTSALRCSSVYAELVLNTEAVTVRRLVSPSGNQPMDFFWGSFVEAQGARVEAWQSFSYRRSEEKKSFSNAMFVALGLPELRGEAESNITMHQLLRMIYTDQKSLTLDLLMTESFDSSITRRAIADLLFGVYDDDLYSSKLELREVEKSLEVKTKQFTGIEQIYSASGNDFSVDSVNTAIANNEEKMGQVESEIENYESSQEARLVEDAELGLKITLVKSRFLEEKRTLTDLQSKIGEYEYELADSREFIASLERRAIAIADSLLTKETFGDVKLTHCPNCLSPLGPALDDDHCVLCKQELPSDKGSSQTKRMQQEVDNQIRESKKMLLQKEHDLLLAKASFASAEQSVRSLQEELNDTLASAKTERNQALEELLVKKGELRSTANYLVKQLRALEQIDVLRIEIKELNQRLTFLKGRVFQKEQDQKNKYKRALESVRTFSLRLLHNDLGRQSEFQTGTVVDLDFERNTFALDGENNFSESSNVYLKNSIRFGVFFASLVHDFFRYPRFILCDNIEDKGMEPVRSQSFQQEIVKISRESQTRHQVIFATSMISPELDNSELCVGDGYTETNKALRNV